MQPDALRRKAGLETFAERLPVARRGPLLRLAGAWLGLLLLFGRDWAAMAGQWWDSSTYNHVLLVPPILGWLVWQRAALLARLEPQGWWPGLVLFGGAALLWTLGRMGEIAQVRQIAVVLMAMATVPALLGPRVAAGLLFPLGYMLVLVPAGDELVPLLQTITAKITILLLDLSRIPAVIDGVFIDTPGGYFRVAEACSGIKFLIATLAYGALAAHVCFVSAQRRALFMLACVVVPVLANGVRAFATIAIAQRAGIGFAAGFDHVFYGWVFFALVLAGLMLASRHWWDRPVDAQAFDVGAVTASPLLARMSRASAGGGRSMAVLAAAALVAFGWSMLAEARSAALPPRIVLPEVPGWHRVDMPPSFGWAPPMGGADHRLAGRYQDASGAVIDVAFGLWSRQGEGAKADGFGQGAVPEGSGWVWQGNGPELAGLPSERIEAPGPVDRIAVTLYRRGGLMTARRVPLKLAILNDRLLLRARPTATLIVSAEQAPGREAAHDVSRFLAAIGPADRWTDTIAAGVR